MRVQVYDRTHITIETDR